MIDFSGDQTQFMFERPVDEFARERELGEPAQGENPAQTPPQSRSRRVLFWIGGLTALLLVFMGLLLLTRRMATPPASEPSPTPTLTPQPSADPIEEKLLEVKRNLNAADPAKSELQFPLIEPDIRLDKKSR